MVQFKKPPFRIWIAAMIFFSTFTNYMLRSNMSVSIVAMIEKKGPRDIPACLRAKNQTLPKKASTGEKQFDWSEGQGSDILASYFWGYTGSILFGGILAELIGPWHVIFWSSIVCTLLTALAPPSATGGGHPGLLANRVLTGFFGGPLYPALQVIMAKWAPPNEKGKFMAALMGNTIGTVYAFIVVGQVTQSFGWPWGFYVLAITMVFYCTAFFFIVSDTPDKSRCVSQEERDYIAAAQGGTVSKTKAVAPVLKILTNLRFWAMTVAQFGNLWALNLILTYAPKFMAETLGFNIRDSAWLSSTPYLARMCTSIVFGMVGDWMRKKGIMSVTNLRKFFIIFSHFIPCACFVLIYAAGCNSAAVIALVILNQGFNGAVVVGHLVNPQDLSPNFAGTCYSIMNFVGMTTGFIVPKITGAINDAYNKSIEASAIIFGIGAVVLASCGLVFVLFGSGDVQPFNEIKTKEPSAEEVR